MSGTGLAILLSVIYVVLIITLAVTSFRKGHWILGLIGFVFPVLWLIGAIPPSGRHRGRAARDLRHAADEVLADADGAGHGREGRVHRADAGEEAGVDDVEV